MEHTSQSLCEMGTKERLCKGRGRVHLLRRAVVAAALCVIAQPALAIPSPDVVVSFFSNAAQIFGLLTLAIGGAFFSRRHRMRRNCRAATQSVSSVPRKLLGVLGVAVVGLLILNTLQWARAVDSKETRLRTNLIRSSTEAGSKVGDVSLKTLSFSAQVNHPLGISTSDLEERLNSADQTKAGDEPETVFIDVREPEEWETGNLDGFSHIRYPELIARAEELKLAGKQPVLLCYSGNRSSELCIALRELGIDCRFVIGGYEKWLAEGREAQLGKNASLDTLRSLPAYPNSDVLLDTPDVQQLVADEQAVFVDVRYPQEFRAQHLPGAINLPIRRMTSAEILAGYEQIPDRPIVAPCYDKRSCFYAQILGLRLHRLGFDFRGRYTVPSEYFTPSAPKPHVKQWLDAQDGTAFGAIRRPFDVALSFAFQRTGDLVLAIFLVLAALRFLLLPFTAKGERDQIIERRIGGRISELKERLKDDPRRLKAAVKALYRENRLTPGRNMIGLGIQIVLLIAFYSAVSATAGPDSGAFLWIPDIGAPDPLFILPILLGTLIFLQLQMNAVRRSRKLLAVRLLSGAFFIGLTVTLKAALTLYLNFGLALMLLQALVVRILVDRTRSQARVPDKPLSPQIAPLSLAHRIPDVGAKAQRMALMMAAGLPVPRGLVVPDAVFPGKRGITTLSEAHRRQLLRLCKRLKMERMAVRSSGGGEDGEDHSYAGVFDSILDVDRDGLLAAVKSVRDSLQSDGSSVYGNDESTGGGVIVQELVDAEYAGVLFTEHPMRSGALLVEMTAGLGDKIASGTAEPDRYGFGRASRQPLDKEEPPIDLTPLVELGLRTEELFGQPQDIEWAYKDGQFLLLQCRNITVLARPRQSDAGQGPIAQVTFEQERHRLLQVVDGGDADDTVLVQNELSELLPRPTPLSLSFMDALWQPGGSVDLACRSLGIPYEVGENADPYVVSVFGALYVNAKEQRRRSRKGLGPVASFRLSRAAERLEQDFLEQFLPGYLSDLRLLDAMDFGRITTGDLIELLEDVGDRYRNESHVHVDVINIAADFYMRAAKRELKKRKLSSSAYLSQGAKTIVHQAISLLQGMRSGGSTPEEFLAFFGHRSDIDYELAVPRYRENVAMMEQLIRNTASMSAAGDDGDTAPDLPMDATLKIAVTRARKFQNLKELAKHYALRELAVIRRILVELDRRFGLDGGIFYLELDELAELRDDGQHADLAQRIEDRKAAFAFFEAMPPLPTSLSLIELERLTPGGDARRDIDRSDDIRGILVAGDKSVVGRARVLTGQDIQAVEDGEIAVARYMHPSWTTIFPRLKGVVTEVGGWLSHTSILAREYNITTIIGVKGAEYQVQTGDMLKLNLDGTIEVVERSERDADAAAQPGSPRARAVAAPAGVGQASA